MRRIVDTVLPYLSNGFVLLIVGSIITSFLVPRFQRDYEERKQRAQLMRQCFEQFLLYSNSLWTEYYAVLPLTQRVEIDADEYLKWQKEITQVKLKRYDAYARVQAQALSFRGSNESTSDVEKALGDYAVTVNAVSKEIDDWLRGLYCTPMKRDKSPCASFDPAFDPYAQYKKIQSLVLSVGNQGGDKVAALMVHSMNNAR
jgi:hypothetical protein